MKSANSVKMLAGFALVLLAVSVTEGRIVSKCELKAKLEAAQLQQISIMGERIIVKSLIARLVCKASTSAFNTSFVKNITIQNNEMNPAHTTPQCPHHAPTGSPPKDPTSKPPPRVRRSELPPHHPTVPPSRVPSSESPPKDRPTGAPPEVSTKPYKPATTKGPQSSGHEMQQTHPSAADKVVAHLYGLFQFSDQLVCDSGLIPSFNICNTSCSAFIDNDITNDITCLKTLTKILGVKPKDVLFDLKKIEELILVTECQSVIPQKYFTGCA